MRGQGAEVLDFEQGAADYGFSMVSDGDVAEVSADAEDNSVLRMGTGRYVLNFDNTVSEDRYLVSFEIRPTTEDSNLVFRLLTEPFADINQNDSEKQYETYYIGKRLGYYVNQNGNSQYQNKAWTIGNRCDMSLDERKRIDMYIDFDKNQVHHYVDNELFAEESLSPCLDEICGFYFTVEKGVMEADNVIFTKVDRSLTKKMDRLGMSYPDNWKCDVAMKLIENEEDAFAFNYFTSSPELTLGAVNEGDAGSYDMKYQLMNEQGIIVWEASETLEFAEGETKTKTITVEKCPYGVLTLIVTATNETTGDVSEYRRNIAVFNAPEDGVTNSSMGFDYRHITLGREHTPKLLEMAKQAGFSAIRFGELGDHDRVQWGVEDEMPLTEYETATLEKIDDLGLFAMILLMGGHTSATTMPREEDGNLDMWQHYVSEVGRLTKDLKGGAAYEVWNEPDAAYFNPNGTRQDYVNLLRTAEAGLKDYIDDPYVVGGAVSSVSSSYFTDIDSSDNSTNNGILRLGAGEYMDIASCHPYVWEKSPEKGGMFSGAKTLRDNLNGIGFDRPIWFTEIGWYTHIGVPKQAIYTTQMFLLNQINGNLAEKIFVYDLIDSDYVPRETFGLFNSAVDYEPYLARPAAVAMANYARLMTGSVYESTIDANETSVYKFGLADDKKLLTFWTQEGSRQVALNLGVDSVEVCDLYGNTETVYGIDGKFQFDANIYPQYVIGSFDTVTECDALFEVECESAEIANHGSFEVSVKNLTNQALTLTTAAGRNMTVSGGGALGGEALILTCSAGDISRATDALVRDFTGIAKADYVEPVIDEYAEGILIKLVDNNENVYYKKTIKVKCVS